SESRERLAEPSGSWRWLYSDQLERCCTLWLSIEECHYHPQPKKPCPPDCYTESCSLDLLLPPEPPVIATASPNCMPLDITAKPPTRLASTNSGCLRSGLAPTWGIRPMTPTRVTPTPSPPQFAAVSMFSIRRSITATNAQSAMWARHSRP